MIKRLLVALVGVVGVVVIGLGVASATVWRADDVLVATVSADEHILVTDPGVLELAATEVTVTVEAEDDQPVVLAVGRDTDVTGWVGTDAHQRVTGLSGWHELAVEDVPAPTPSDAAPSDPAATDAAAPADPAATDAPAEEPAADAAPVPVPDPTGSDLWVAEASGAGSAELTWTAQPGRWSVLAVGTGEAPLQLSLAWPQVVTTPWLVPCVVVGSLLLLISLALLARGLLRGRRRPEQDWTPVLTGPLPVVDADGVPVQLTRRQMREQQARGADAGVRAGRDESTPAGDVTHASTGARQAVGPSARDADATATTTLPVATSAGPGAPLGRTAGPGAASASRPGSGLSGSAPSGSAPSGSAPTGSAPAGSSPTRTPPAAAPAAGGSAPRGAGATPPART
ncbi:hypothetical protein E5226_17420, partial [Cellulomonas shaoxiangyii]